MRRSQDTLSRTTGANLDVAFVEIFVVPKIRRAIAPSLYSIFMWVYLARMMS